MIKFGKGVVKARWIIFIVSLALLIPAALGYFKTRVNYDILSYLPKDIETMKGQDILIDQFGTGGFSLFIAEGMSDKDVVKLEDNIKQVEGVKDVIWYDTIADINIPKDMLPEKAYNLFNHDDCTMMAILFSEGTSADVTMDAITTIQKMCGKQCFLSGMSAVVTDTKALSNKETPIYVMIAVALSLIVLAVTMDSFLVPLFFLLSIGIAIVYNLGSNIFLGEISYITQALTAVLQLGVTMDYSIFLYNSYEEQKKRYDGDKNRAMAHAISNTLSSVVGSSITTVAGFIALCFMSFTLGMDLGVVMAKGVVFGVICCVTVLPSMILIFDKAIVKTTHKQILPEFHGVSKLVTKYYIVFAILFIVLLVPALYGYKNTSVYYNLDETLPKDLASITANTKLKEEFNMNSTHMVLCDANMTTKQINDMTTEMDKVDGVKAAVGLDSLIGPMIPEDTLPDSIKDVLQSDEYKLLLVSSEYKVASDEVNNQVTELNTILKKYDSKGMLIGEAPCTKDLITITDKDFSTVSIVSIAAIFVIILVVFKSITLPIILVAVIELAIFINMGIPYYTGTTIPFIASVVIGTIQLGATVDYAILMTTRYKKERHKGVVKKEAVRIASYTSTKSIIISGCSFFAATFGVGLYSNIDMISSLCTLMARGALISMAVVLFILPSMFMVFDKLIMHSTIGFKAPKGTEEILVDTDIEG